jgi:hypothetical protein
LTSVISAQENWGPAEQLWIYGSIDPIRLDPIFSPNANETIFTCDDDGYNSHRIYIANGNNPQNRTLFLDDSLSVGGYDDVTPYLAYDLSFFYFASNRPGGYGGFDIWMCEWLNGEWTLPFNLGPNINSELDDVSPSLTGLNDELYFQRGEYDTFGLSEGAIFFSEVVGGQWSVAIDLPYPVNSDYDDIGPVVNIQGTKLYFLSDRPNNTDLSRVAWVSYREANVWQEPTILLGEVNEIIDYYPPWYGYYNPESLSIDFTNMRLLFYKTGIDYGMPDYDLKVFESTLFTGIDDDITLTPDNISISAYPNPFNSSINITLDNVINGTLTIYDLLGRAVIIFDLDASNNSINWDGHDSQNNECVSGIYFIRLSSAKSIVTRSVTLLK